MWSSPKMESSIGSVICNFLTNITTLLLFIIYNWKHGCPGILLVLPSFLNGDSAPDPAPLGTVQNFTNLNKLIEGYGNWK